MKCLCTFEVTSMAIMFEKHCRAAGFAVRVTPVPRQISASCGLACAYPCESEAAIRAICEEKHIDVTQWHHMEE